MGRQLDSSGVERRGVDLVAFPHRDRCLLYVIAPRTGLVDKAVQMSSLENTSGSR